MPHAPEEPGPPAAGLRADFRGPYRDGPPPDALRIDLPDLHRFGLGEVRRMAVIGAVLAATVLQALAAWVVRRRGRRLAVAVSEGVVDGFERVGPTYVKLGQLIASSPSLFPAPLADACLRMLDDVAPVDTSLIRDRIEADLGEPVSALFRSFDDRSLSAASIAQVHACVLPDGRPAVVKVQRPDIAERMNTDLRILYRFARMAMRTEGGQRANAVAMVEDLHEVTNQELNFALEAWRQERFRSGIGAFGDNDHVTAPEVYWDWCGPHVICMQQMSGVPMDQFDALAERAIDGELVLRRGIKVWVEAALVHGPFHGDVHAGNLWLLDDGRSTYLDFGIMGELAPEWKATMRDILYTSMIDQDYRRVVRAYQKVGVMPAEVDPEVAGPAIATVMEPMLSQGLAGVTLGESLKANMELAKEHGSTTPRELVLVFKQMLYFERYARVLAPDYVMARDIFLLQNIFPDEVAKAAAERGVELPD